MALYIHLCVCGHVGIYVFVYICMCIYMCVFLCMLEYKKCIKNKQTNKSTPQKSKKRMISSRFLQSPSLYS